MNRVVPAHIRRIVEQTINTIIEPNLELNKIISSGAYKGQSVVDSYTIGSQVEQLLDLISNVETANADKIKIAEYLCHRLYDIYRLSLPKQERIISGLRQAIYNANDLPNPMRLYYLRFRNEKISYAVSEWLYDQNSRDILEIVPYFQILKYLLRSYLANDEIKTTIYTEFNDIFENEDTDEKVKMEIADIFILTHHRQRGEEMLDILRERERERDLIHQRELIAQGIIVDDNYYHGPHHLGTVYTDSQNVHNRYVNDSVLKACVHLISLIGVVEPDQTEITQSEEVKQELMEIDSTAEYSINIVLERIEIDESRFRYKNDMFSLYNVFSCLWVYIKRHPSKNELKMRLLEEIIAMANYCSTGHLSRLMNVIQGFTDDENLCVHISNKDQIKAVILSYLNKICSDASDTILDAMIGGDQTLFYNFVEEQMNKKIDEILKKYEDEFEDIRVYIIDAIIAYTKHSNWKIIDNKLHQLKIGEEDSDSDSDGYEDEKEDEEKKAETEEPLISCSTACITS